MSDKRKIIEEKIEFLDRASRAYYQEARELVSDHEYDRLYDELQALEKETGIVLSNSPTVNVGYEVVSGLPKQKHPVPMLSLDKTKETEVLRDWLGDRKGALSWKLDGLTIVLTYEDGRLEEAVTRGDGTTGEVITNNARVFDNVPLVIPHKHRITVRGEAVISYDDFREINRIIPDADAKYKNPRNLCSGTVRQLDNSITAQRHVRFFAFTLAEGPEMETRQQQYEWMRSQGFETVAYVMTDADSIAADVADFEKKIADFELPSDGLVLIYDDIAYGRSLGATAKFPKDAIAFKWKDEIRETTLKRIHWNASRTGLINPIAEFEPVELEGTTVSRASVHNLSIVKELQLGEGDRIEVYKANMIIPQIASNLTKSGTVKAPEVCPVCGHATEIRNDNDVETVYCPNSSCAAKQIKSFTHFVSRNAMNIEGLSEATLTRFIEEGMISEFADLFRMDIHREGIVSMDNFGEKSYDNLIKAVDKARHTSPERLLFSLGIPGIGAANARMISLACGGDWDRMMNITEEELIAIDGIGEKMAKGYTDFFADEEHLRVIKDLLPELDIKAEAEENNDKSLDGLTFVITGKVHRFDNRDAVKKIIQQSGGKVASAVSSRTDYLINNDSTSASSKNRKARELGIPVITEDEFIRMLEG